MRISETIEKVRHTSLPDRYKEKICYDLQQISDSEIKDLQAIVLFGSCARGTMRVGSDVDLLLLTRKTVPREIRGEISSDLAEEKQGIATDVVFYTAEEFAHSDCRLVQEIRKDGIVLWETDHV